MITKASGRFIAAALAAASMVAGTPVLACQGPQFESSLVLFSDTASDTVAEGSRQIKVRISEYSLRNIHDRVLIMAYVIPEDGEKIGKYTKASSSVAIVKPVGTSCDYVAVPAPGEYYVTGSFAKGEKGARVKIGGYDLFYPKFDRVKSDPFQ